MIRAEDGDPGHPAPRLHHLLPLPPTSCLCVGVKSAEPLTSPPHPPDPADSLLPCRPGPAQPGLPVCGAAQRSPRSSALSTGDRLFGIYPRRCACLFICSLFHGSKKQFLLPLISPTTTTTTHPSAQPVPPSSHLPPLPPPTPSSSSPTSAPNPILLKTVIEQRCMLGLGPLLGEIWVRAWTPGTQLHANV